MPRSVLPTLQRLTKNTSFRLDSGSYLFYFAKHRIRSSILKVIDPLEPDDHDRNSGATKYIP